jgi:hypothetical protein
VQVACQVALGALPRLPKEMESALRAPVQELCDLVQAGIQRIDPAYKIETRE